MVKMEITLHLKGHCIETAARKRYEQLVRELLKEDDERKEKELELLVEFLNTANFSELRRSGFDGSKDVVVRVRKSCEGFVVEEIQS